MILMDLNVTWKIRVEVRLVGGTEAENKIAFKITRVVEMSSGSNNKMKLKSDHVTEICLIYKQERRPKQFFSTMHLRKVVRDYFFVCSCYGCSVSYLVVTLSPKEVE